MKKLKLVLITLIAAFVFSSCSSSSYAFKQSSSSSYKGRSHKGQYDYKKSPTSKYTGDKRY